MPIYKKDLEPFVLPEENILIRPDNVAYKVISVEPLPTYTYDFGALAANSRDAEVIDIVKETAKLAMPKNTLAQFRMKVLDNFELYFRQPKTTSKFATVYLEFFVNQNTPQDNLTEWFQFEDRSAGIVRKNPTNTALTSTRVMFYGFKFELEELKRIPEKFAVITIGEA